MKMHNLDPIHLESAVAEQQLLDENPQQAGELRRRRIWLSILTILVLLGVIALLLRSL